MPDYGAVAAGFQIEDALLDTLKLWVPDSLRAIEQDFGYEDNQLPNPRSYEVWPEASIERWPEDQLPAIAVASSGTSGEPIKDGSGYYRARWDMAVGVIVSANSKRATMKLASVYAAAIKLAVLQRRSLGGETGATDWHGDSNTEPLEAGDARSLAVATVSLTVDSHNVVSTHMGPVTPIPPTSPFDDLEGFPYDAEEAQLVVQSKEE